MDEEAREPDPFEVGQITEQIPAWELWEDGIEPEDNEISPPRIQRDRAA
jgi:hypothetical protein